MQVKPSYFLKSMLNINSELQFKAFVWPLHGHTYLLHCCRYRVVFPFYRNLLLFCCDLYQYQLLSDVTLLVIVASVFTKSHWLLHDSKVFTKSHWLLHDSK